MWSKIAINLKAMAKMAYRLNPKIQDSVNINIDFFKSQIKHLGKVIAQELQAIPQTLILSRVLVLSWLAVSLPKLVSPASRMKPLWPSTSVSPSPRTNQVVLMPERGTPQRPR